MTDHELLVRIKTGDAASADMFYKYIIKYKDPVINEAVCMKGR